MTKPTCGHILPLCLAIAVACNGDSIGPDRVLTTLEVSAPNTPLFQDYTSQLTISAWDQFGSPMLEGADGEWARKATYVTNAPKIAAVSAGGIVRGVAPGKAEIIATLTVDGVTRMGTLRATVLEPLQTAATLIANAGGGWSPATVRLKAGGNVTWVVPQGVHVGTIWFNVWGTNAEEIEFIDGQATRKFPTPGTFSYGDGGGLVWYERNGVVYVY